MEPDARHPDPSHYIERTALAWNRTALALAGTAGLAGRAAVGADAVTGGIVTAVLVALAVDAWSTGRRRLGRGPNARRLAVLSGATAGTGVLMAVGALV